MKAVETSGTHKELSIEATFNHAVILPEKTPLRSSEVHRCSFILSFYLSALPLSWSQAIDRVVKSDLRVAGSGNLFTSVDLQTDRFIHCQISGAPNTASPSVIRDERNKDVRL